MLLAAIALAVVGLAACQKEKETIDDPTGGAYTTELVGTEWIAYDTMDAYQGTGKVVLIVIYQFKDDGVAYDYLVDYPDDPCTDAFCTYSYQFDGNKGEMTVTDVDFSFPMASSIVGNVYSLKYDGKKDVVHMTGPKGKMHRVLRRLK